MSLPPIGALLLAVAVCSLVGAPAAAQPDSEPGWPHYGGDLGGARYSAAAQIDRANVGRLRLAWTYRTGALGRSAPLDPRTGAKLWEYDAALDLSHGYSEVTSRGVSAWRDPAPAPGQPCRTRIFMGTLDARLVALDGDTGKPCAGFGASGQVDLTRGVDLRDLGNYQVTSAPTVTGDVIIVGSSTPARARSAGALRRGTTCWPSPCPDPAWARGAAAPFVDTSAGAA